MNRPYKSTSLDELVIICRNVPDRDVHKAILTELSHRETKPAKKLEAILVKHLVNQSGDGAVGSKKTASSHSQITSVDSSEPVDTGARITRAVRGQHLWNTDLVKSQNRLSKRRPSDATKRKKSRRAHVPRPASNILEVDQAARQKRRNEEQKDKAENPSNAKMPSQVSQTDSNPGTQAVGRNQGMLKVAAYTGGLIIVAASFGYSYFLYNQRVQTAANPDKLQQISQASDKSQNILVAPVKSDLGQDIVNGVEMPIDNELAQKIPNNVVTPVKNEFVRILPESLEAPVKVEIVQDVEIGIDAYDRGDYPTALREFQALSEQGNADAQYYLGLMFDRGHGVLEDPQGAARLYQKSADQGNSEAQLMLGVIYYEGEDVLEDFEEAAKWYRLSAEQGNGDAQNRLGFMYEKGYGVVQDYDLAAKWYRKSAEQGNVNAQKNLSARYFLGQGVNQDNVYAHMWATIAASQGNETAMKVGDIVAKKMTTSDISKAQKLAKDCVVKKYRAC